MRKADLLWKPRFAKKNRGVIIAWIKKHYDQVQLFPDRVQITHPEGCTKFLWIFMLSKAFTDVQSVPQIAAIPNRHNRKEPHAIPGYKEKTGCVSGNKKRTAVPSRRKRRAT